MSDAEDLLMQVRAIRTLADVLERGEAPSKMLRSMVASALGLEREELQDRNIGAITEQTTASDNVAKVMSKLTTSMDLLTTESAASRKQMVAVAEARQKDATARDARLEKWARMLGGAIIVAGGGVMTLLTFLAANGLLGS